MEETNSPFLSNRGFEISRVAFLLIISVLLGVTAWVWNTTVSRIDSEISYQRHYLESIDERIRITEMANERQTAAISALGGRLDAQRERIKDLNDLYYGPLRRKP